MTVDASDPTTTADTAVDTAGTAPALGLTLPQRGALFGVATVGEMLDLAVEADAGGAFDSVWVGDSLTAKPRQESVTMLAAVAARTTTVRLGTACMASFPVRDPVTFAYQWASLDVLSGGRTRLNACTGLVAHDRASAREGAHWGVEDRERAARMEEHIAICRRLWTEDDVTFAGRFRSFEGLTIEPKPVQRPCPVWIAANPFPGPFYERSLRRVATLADGWMSVELAPGMLGDAWRHVRAYLEKGGRDPEAFPTVAYHNVNVAADRGAALEETSRFLDAYYGPSFTDAMKAAWTAAGTVDEVAADLRALVAAGARSIAVRFTSWDQRGQFKRFVEEVVPRLRTAAA